MPKISIIGAGSAVFSLSLIRDLCLTPNLSGSTVSFMDIDQDRLDSAYGLCRRYADELGIDLRLEKTMDRRESIRGADFVIITALVGGHQHMRDGWNVAKKHGYKFGGSLHILHDEGFWINFGQFRLMESILKDVMELSPKAWYMLIANPVMAGVTYMSRKYPHAKIAGFCHGSNGVSHVAKVLGLDPEHISFELPGVNHFIWLTDFHYKGEDAFPLLDRWIEEKSEAYFTTCPDCDGMGPKAVDLYKRFGAFPIGDTGNPGGGAWGYWYHSDDETQRKWKEDPDEWYEGYFRHCAHEVQRMHDICIDKSAKVTDLIPPIRSTEPMIPFVESIVCDIPRVIILNVMNTGGYVAGIPTDFQVEIPVYVTASGLKGIDTKGLPRPLIQLALRDRVAPVEMELQAYENGSQEQLLQLILMDPWTKSEEQARAFLDELLSLPRFEEMRHHYR